MRRILNLPIEILQWFSDVLARIGRVMSSAFYFLVPSTRGAGRFGRAISAVIGFVLSPVAGLSDRLSRLGRRRKVHVGYDEHREEELLQKQLSKHARRDRNTQRITFVGRVGAVVLWPIRIFFTFIARLLSTRTRQFFLWGIPVLAVVGLLGFTTYYSNISDVRQIANRYERASADAIKVGDFETAELFQHKLEQLGVPTDTSNLQKALLLEESGQKSAAAEVMQTMASTKDFGHPAAHFWLAKHLVAGDIPELNYPDSLNRARKHLVLLRQNTGDAPEIQFLTALTYLKAGDVQSSIAALGNASEELVDAAGLRMMLHLAVGDRTNARSDAYVFQLGLRKLNDQGGVIGDQIAEWAQVSADLLGDTELSSVIVRRNYESDPENISAKRRQVRQWVRDFEIWSLNPDKETIEVQSQQLLQAAKIAKDDISWKLVGPALLIVERNEDRVEFLEIKKQLVDSKEVSGRVLEFFGTQSAVRADWATADQLLKRSVDVSPKHAQAWNNWGWVIQQAFPDRLEEALEHLDRAISIEPDNVDYHDTRGSILIDLERWDAAIDDLTLALNGGHANPERLHRMIAEAYDRLGNPRLASHHRNAAKSN